MRIALIVLALVTAGCGGGTGSDPDVSGTLIIDPPAGRDTDAYIATEAEVLRSQTLRDALKSNRQLELAAGAVVVTPKPGTRVIEVGVRDPDRQRAAQLCNELMRTYVEYRMSLGQEELVQRQQVLAAPQRRAPPRSLYAYCFAPVNPVVNFSSAPTSTA